MELEIAKEAEKIYKDYDISLEKAIEIAKNILGGYIHGKLGNIEESNT